MGRFWKIGTVVSAIAVVILLVVGLLVGTSNKKHPAAADPTTTTSTTTTVVAGACSPQGVVDSVLKSAGFSDGQFTIGEDKFDLSLPAALEAGKGRFADKPLTNVGALTSFIGSDEPGAQALLDAAVKQSGGTKEQALDPGNWVGFQLLTKSDWSGNTLFVDGKVKPAGTRHSAKGDIGWMFINPSDCSTKANVVRVAIVRLGCANPQLVPPTPAGTPPPPTPRQPTPTSTVPPTTVITPPPIVVNTTTTVPSTTVPSTTTSTTRAPGKATPGTTVAPPPTTVAPSSTTSTTLQSGQAGAGATNTTVPPTTVAPAPPPSVATSPTSTTNPPKPPG